VHLDTDAASGRTQHLHQNGQAVDHRLRPLEHQAVVGGEVGLALRPVQNHHVDALALRQPHLDVGGIGGATQTHAIAATSPARDNGNPSTCAATDQRGVARPQGEACDIGAFEIAPPTISKAFSPDTITTGGVSTLTFTVTTLLNTGALTGVRFTDTMPAAIVVAATPNVQNTCGGTPTAASGTSQIGLSGGALAGNGASCTVSVNVTSATAGSHVNTSGAVSSTETGNGNTASATLNVTNAVPTISSLNPSSIVAGSGAFTLTVNGTGFANNSVVRWNGITQTTTFVSSTQVQAAIAATAIASPGSASVTVFNPAPAGGASNAATLTIVATGSPLPTATSLSPNTVVAGSDSFTLNITGTGFINGVSTVRWNDAPLTPTVQSATTLAVTIPANLIAKPGTANVTVFNAAPGGGESSPALKVTISAPQVTIASLNPNSATAGGAGFDLVVNGTGFINGVSEVRWNGAARKTTFVSATQLRAVIPASNIASAGAYTVTVANGNTVSKSRTFTVNNPKPAITKITPNSIPAGSSALTLTVDGSGFIQGSKVVWNSTALTTTFVSATKLTATIPASLVANPGTAAITVLNTTPGGGPSNSLPIVVSPAQQPENKVFVPVIMKQ
ncbi:MAG: hypothetical protein MI924_15355, partial [Chloroflexales bacterium]|nr:hypothetical protein [Chloroflexales bacterium]